MTSNPYETPPEVDDGRDKPAKRLTMTGTTILASIIYIGVAVRCAFIEPIQASIYSLTVATMIFVLGIAFKMSFKG